MKNLVQKIGTLTILLASMMISTANAGMPEQPKMMFIDLLPVLEGVKAERVEEYFRRIGDVVDKHGLKRVGSFKVTKKLNGETNPQYVNLWVVKSGDTFGNIFEDKDYQKHIEFRNSTFDMSNAEMFMLAPNFSAVDFSSVLK